MDGSHFTPAERALYEELVRLECCRKRQPRPRAADVGASLLRLIALSDVRDFYGPPQLMILDQLNAITLSGVLDFYWGPLVEIEIVGRIITKSQPDISGRIEFMVSRESQARAHIRYAQLAFDFGLITRDDAQSHRQYASSLQHPVQFRAKQIALTFALAYIKQRALATRPPP